MRRKSRSLLTPKTRLSPRVPGRTEVVAARDTRRQSRLFLSPKNAALATRPEHQASHLTLWDYRPRTSRISTKAQRRNNTVPPYTSPTVQPSTPGTNHPGQHLPNTRDIHCE